MRWPGLPLALSTALSCALAPSSARAERPDTEVAARLAFLSRSLEVGTPAAARWSYGWFATFGALTAAQFGVALGAKDPGLRADMAVGAVSSSLGMVPFALVPFTPRFAAAELARLPERTAAERRRKLARAEVLLKKSADAERLGRSWVPHVAGIGVSLAWGFVLALAYQRVRTGVVNTLGGVAIVEAQIFTQPTDAIVAWEAYARGAFRGPERPRGVSFAIVPAPSGLGLGGRF